jgi:SAM-dependent methyltransferase
MAVPKTYSFVRYLAAKKSVDDRALNRRVLQNLTQALSKNVSRSPLRVVEIGAGIGTMAERLVDLKLLKRAAYTAIDGDPDLIAEACRRVPRWAKTCGYALNAHSREKLALKRGDQDILVEFEAIAMDDLVAREKGHRSWDLLIASAFLDLVDTPSTLPRLFSLLRPGGLFYFAINFDGETIFEPEIDPVLDAQITGLYHATMNHRVISGKPSGNSCSGRHLFATLQACGVELLDAGSSDWVVFAGSHGYLEDEAYFLHYIIHTVQAALDGHPDLDPALFASWIRERHNHIEQGILVYIAHQLDFLGRVP